ncbi:hypothetical protein K490DRAFT_65970 [Saccharata proteae CBS 121410]|uniref:Uncharacterized protein n=1 Tax=Saccharata proteae CBS 121410 TaxID=1314787 RepID=A0A9P4LV34_9PEZI|nr:hypothetical protein K490DRAFT_65970 [Saccharata proteae CBS 121410]
MRSRPLQANTSGTTSSTVPAPSKEDAVRSLLAVESRLRWSDTAQSRMLHLVLQLRAELSENRPLKKEINRLREELQHAGREYRRAAIQLHDDAERQEKVHLGFTRIKEQFFRTFKRMEREMLEGSSYLNDYMSKPVR